MVAILYSAILDSTILLKTLTPINSIWLKVIHSDSSRWWQPSWIQPFSTKKLHSFILTQLDDGSHLEFGHLGFSYLSFFSQTHSHLPRLVPNICTKNFTHSFWLNLMIAAILKSAILDSAILYQKNFTHSFSLTLMMATILYSAILDSAICTKKNFTHAFSQKLLIAAILNLAMLDSDTLFSSLWITQKHSLSTLNLIQTNSIWLTRWWQPSWILPSYIQSCCTKVWLSLIQSDSNSFILTELDDGSHLGFCHVGLRHCHLGFRQLVIFSQIHSKTLSLHSDSDSN